ncbi:MAG TPA: V-type ATP synthase subunit I [Candidatus Mediterraneibacter pullicola]|uniref:V-type ATP synthase subunit I n=2 Tax=Mediterraneibacter TaxID=2316020 RepID=A0A9D2H7X4_9FIRM|nr:V-type ATP synthase subunit I [Candidatus Mediterraneibacter caccavium]HJA06352.1 V-type ATP synthase subunit I [Candidatus Mediterraneibacter pullicola]
MAVLKMQRISICALKKDRKAILEKLQSMGVLEVNHVIDEDEDFKKMDTAGQRMGFEKAAASVDQALAILEKYIPEDKSVFAALEGKRLVEPEEERRVQEERRELLKTAKTIHDLDREYAEQVVNITKLRNSIESLKPWLALDVPLKPADTKRVGMFLGTMPGGTTAESVYGILAEKASEAEADVHLISSEQSMVYLAVLCLKEDMPSVEDALRSAGFARPSQTWDTVPAVQKEKLEQQIADCQDKISEIKKDIEGLSKQREKLKIAADYYRVRADKYAVLGDLPQSERTFVISGYIPKCEAPHVADYLAARYDCMVDVEELKEDEEAPVILKNNPFSMNMEGIVESYGLPHKGELDPTTIMSFFYIFFFGMMLSDAAYGAIVSIVCGILVWKFPRMSDSMKKSLKLFFYCGLSTLVWGILFGGYFGNIVDIVSEKFFGTAVTVPALWFIPLNDPMKLLVFSLLFGVIHLFVGLGIKGYLCLRDGKAMDFFCDVVLWFLLLVGLIFMLLPSDIFASIAQTNIVFPGWLNTAAKVLAVIGASGIVLMSGRENKNPALRIALGAYDLYNITGWLSDALSYSRLLALGLATGVIASVINQMGSMLPNNVVGVIFFIVIFIVGHALNLAINLLGAYVHTNRLQFVEFFGKFYEGGGRPFAPFKENTKYADVKEETIL